MQWPIDKFVSVIYGFRCCPWFDQAVKNFFLAILTIKELANVAKYLIYFFVALDWGVQFKTRCTQKSVTINAFYKIILDHIGFWPKLELFGLKLLKVYFSHLEWFLRTSDDTQSFSIDFLHAALTLPCKYPLHAPCTLFAHTC